MSGGIIRVDVEAVAVLGAGLPDWDRAQPVLMGSEPYCPEEVVLQPPPELSPAERRRAIPSVRLALAVGAAAVRMSGRAAQGLATVFASSGLDGETIDTILTTLATPNREVSPTRFHNSVHNAAAGYWGLATQSQGEATSVCAYDASFSAGLLEASVQAVSTSRPVLLVAYDLPYPGPLAAVRPILGRFGVALVVTPAGSDRAFAHLGIRLAETDSDPTGCADAGLEAQRCGNPAARSLPLLITLAHRRREEVRLALARGGLLVEVEPC